VKLAKLHEEFIEASRRPMEFGRLPINAREVDIPIVPMERWALKGNPKVLSKTFRFARKGDRNRMLQELLDYEDKTHHHARIILDEDALRLLLITKNINQVTEVDKEYARYADQVFKDVVFAPDTEHLKEYM
jgi:pterin-4a-carbinolamine dehydratase